MKKQMEQQPNHNAIGRVMADLAIENADLRITIETLRDRIRELEAEKQGNDEEKE